MGYYVNTHDSYLRWKEGTDLDNVANIVREVFFADAQYDDDGLYQLLGRIFGDVTVTTQVERLFYVSKDDKIDAEEELLYLIAPFLEDGSYLRYRGDDGALFGWTIYENAAIPQHAILTWVDTDKENI